MDGKKVVTNILLFAAGAGLGYATAWAVEKRKWMRLLHTEIDQVKESYSSYQRYAPYKSPEEAVAALIPESDQSEMQELLVDNGYVQVVDGDKVSVENFDGEVIAEGVVRANENGELEIDTDQQEKTSKSDSAPVKYNNLFNEKGPARKEDDLSNPERLTKELPARMGAPTSIMEEELPVDQERMLRSPDKPYIITVNQFMTDDMHEDDRITLTYFEEDDTLCDEKETIVPNREELVGEVNLHHFGLGSDDKNAVYIRNERIHADFEVIRDERGFQEVVLNIKPTREKTGPLKLREYDE